ncbi:PTS sugar transporter subunit IIA [Geomesophilobacter sediminis]|uniref:PTS sugar transporter subunit IIA n=1 Tax=Geomesophilobacter sediminis TaxID=2798584 RepID=A0A8J7M4M3_9BACT|nr:PTS sugar transporter subunit IIA [Geomesophilobacter sediminis]MBJ6727863.1 PTS sugar transporter subunit IIA [Geomesophilobacter sediminis]
MLIKASEVAELLTTDEQTVIKWVRKEKLPATLVRGSYRINRVDLLEWATEHGITVPPELFAAAEADIHYPTLTEALTAGGIHCNVQGTDKLSVLKNVVSLLKLPPQMDPDFLLQVLLAREALGTTAVGRGIAIPHVRNPILLQNKPEPAITLCFLANPIDFGALDGEPVRILFLLTSPTVKVHLHLLSKLSYALHDEEFRGVLGRACDPEGILGAAQRFDQPKRK